MRSAVLVALFLAYTATAVWAVPPANPGDLNGDGVVNIQDVLLVSGCLGQNAATCQSGKADPNNDGAVNLFDFVHISQRWGNSYGVQPTLLLQENFEDNQLLTRGWYDNPNGLLSTTEHVAGSTASMEYRFNAGGTTSTQGKTARHLFTASDQVYVSFWIKYSSNWVGSQVSYHPHQFHLVNDQENQYIGPSISHSTFYIEENGGKPLLAEQVELNIYQTKVNQNLIGVSENRATAGCNGNTPDGATYDCYAYNASFYTNSKTWKSTTQWFSNTVGPTYKNDWHFIEAYYKLNTVQNGVGLADGIAQYWYDGQPVINVQNALFRTGINANMKLNQFIIAPYIGVGSPVQQSFWVDNLTIMTSRPGSYTPPPPPSPVCGNGAVESGEQCDLGATNGACPSACSATCTTNTCPVCGNGILEAGEQCDGVNLGGATCQTQGFSSGTLTCSAACTYDTAQCTNPPPSSSHPNEPAGMLPYADLDFSGATSAFVKAGNTAFVDGNTYVPPVSPIGTTIAPPGPGPESPGGIFQIKMPYHMTSGRGSGSGDVANAPKAKTIYFSGWFKVSNNWYGENTQPPGTGVIKMIMPLSQSTTWSAVANRLIISAAHGSGPNALSARVAWQQVVSVNGNTQLSTSYFAPKAGTGSIQRNQWHHIEFVTVANNAGVADGRFQMWVDGAETHNVPNIQYDPTADIKWQTVDLNSVYGGPTNQNATPDDQYIWWDHAYMSYSTQQK